MTATDVAAWVGAVAGMLVLFWDVYKWKTSGRPRLRVQASPNMQAVAPGTGQFQEQPWVVVKVANTGDQKTTLTHLLGFHYRSRLHKLFRMNPANSFFVATPAFGQGLPYVLAPGEEWLGAVKQSKELEQLARENCLYCGVHHSSGRRPVLARVNLK